MATAMVLNYKEPQVLGNGKDVPRSRRVPLSNACDPYVDLASRSHEVTATCYLTVGVMPKSVATLTATHASSDIF